MASRTILRRLVHVSRRAHIRGGLSVRSLSLMRQVIQQCEQKSVSHGTSYSQVRALCTKPGEGMIINIQDEQDFEDRVINNEKPVVVDFHARYEFVYLFKQHTLDNVHVIKA